ncbi:MAG: hypothetical protein CMP48_03845 [Rickettsiales bacterium]|nr:hypothetical protein [Rickettsiales bacterium]
MRFLYILLASLCYSNLLAQEQPFSVADLFDMTQPETLGLDFAPGLETAMVYSPTTGERAYNHGVVLYPFKGKLYAMWQSSLRDEDGDDTQVYYSMSEDGLYWQQPITLTQEQEDGIKTSGGWWSYGDTLVAFCNVWPDTLTPKGGFTEFRLSVDGINWSEAELVKDSNGQPMRGIIEQDIRSLPSGMLLTAFHVQPGLHAKPHFTEDPLGISGWKKGLMENMNANDASMSRELEPSWFVRKDGAVVMVFRDQNSSFKKLAALSADDGETWTTPVVIDTPDSRSKQSAGNLTNGSAFMVYNPSGSKERFPLVVVLSDSGKVFDRAYLLRSGSKEDLQPIRFEGKYKRVGYSYPKSIIWNGYLYVGYATNKEDVQLTRIPVQSLMD